MWLFLILAACAASVVASGAGSFAAGDDTKPTLATCRARSGDDFVQCISAATTAGCEGCATALPRVTVRGAVPRLDPFGGERIEGIVENATTERIFFVAFGPAAPDYVVERRRDGEWKYVPWSGCGNALDQLHERSLGPGERAVFLLDYRARHRPFRVGVWFWLASGRSWTVWSEPYEDPPPAEHAPCDAPGSWPRTTASSDTR